MADDRTKRGAPDNQRIDTSNPSELRNWSKSLDATPEQIKNAVSKVGTSADRVRQYLRGK